MNLLQNNCIKVNNVMTVQDSYVLDILLFYKAKNY